MRGRRFLIFGLATALAILLSGAVANGQSTGPAGRWDGDPALGQLKGFPYYPAGQATTATERTPATAVGVVAPATAPWSKLVYESLRDDNWDIYLADGDGSGEVRLTDEDSVDMQARLNRGCTRIAFASDRRDNYEIFTMTPDGSDVRRLTSNSESDTNPTWSPDGSRIAFQSYRDGQWEIYVMNADGSGQTRLTSNPAYDGLPAWSPDGTQIAFTSRRSGDAIWVMGADGSNPHAIAGARYAQHSAWSPDGTQIAFDADGDNDEWNEIWLVNADGSNPRQVYDAGGTTETWVRTWSADGRHVGYTRINLVYYQGNWYWTEAFVEGWDTGSGGTVRMSTHDTDWNPDWGNPDLLAPASGMTPLAAESPSPFTVAWSGNDAGPAGVRGYDVQVREGALGAWGDWLTNTAQTSAIYPGIGGRSFYFRVRARDNAYNLEAWPADYDSMTTVEARPPQTAVKSLQEFSRGNVVQLKWDGLDPGGSGIEAFDVQVRDGSGGAWTDLQTGTVVTEAQFSGESGHTYYFRSRGRDRAQNLESWPAGDGDTSTTFYALTLTSAVSDNRGVPLAGVTLSLEPPAVALVPGGGEGTYLAYIAEGVGSLSAGWSKAGYKSLPQTEMPVAVDARYDVTLPPGDNVVANWGFEEELSGWTASGEIMPAITDIVRHTGKFAAILGQAFAAHKPCINISQDPTVSSDPQVAIDAGGAIHVVWRGDGIYYVRRDPDGVWGSAQKVADIAPGSFDPRIALDRGGNLHVIWRQSPEPPEVYYIRRDANGAWSSPQNITNTPDLYSWAAQVAVDEVGGVHVVWREFNHSTESSIRYARRGPDGTWSPPQNLSGELACEWPALAVEAAGTVDVVWSCSVSDNREVFHARRSPAGFWSTPQNVSNNPGSSIVPALAVEANGRVHVTWSDYSSGRMDTLYAWQSSDGTWSSPETVAEGIGGDDYTPQVAVDDAGVVHATARGQYMARGSTGGWSPPVVLGAWPHMVVNPNGAVQMASVGWPAGSSDILYARRYGDGVWSAMENVSESPSYSQFPRLAVDPTGAAHVVWEDYSLGNVEVYYAEPVRSDAGGNSELAQTVSVPADAASPTLSFLYRLEGTPENGANWFEVRLQQGPTVTTLFSTGTSSGAWSHRWFDLTPWRGKTFSLYFMVHQTAGRLPVWAYLDEVTLGSAYPDTWVAVRGPAAAPSGGALEYTIRYGNRGAVLAAGARITDTLPSELLFVSAEPPPDLVALPLLVWEIGELDADSQPGSIEIKAAVKPDVAPFRVFTNKVQIGSVAPELETVNNTSWAGTVAAYLTYLPVVMK